MSGDVISFFLAWLSSPRRVASVTPSSDALAELITREITPSSAPVIELGPGTGVFTYKLLDKGIRPEDITLVEAGSDFVRLLQLRFPGTRILWMDAARLASAKLAEDNSIGSVVSGLPLLTMSPKKIISILTGAFRHMRPGGAFYQFTYGPTAPIPRPILDRLGLKATLLGRTMNNLPPAAVYKITKRSPIRLVQDHDGVWALDAESLSAATGLVPALPAREALPS